MKKVIEYDVKTFKTDPTCSDFKHLLDYTPKEWLENRPVELIQLISVLLDIDPDEDSYQFAKIIELMYSTKRENIVLSAHFRESLMAFSNSKPLVNLLSKSSPSGGYTTLTNFLGNNTNPQFYAREKISELCLTTSR